MDKFLKRKRESLSCVSGHSSESESDDDVNSTLDNRLPSTKNACPPKQISVETTSMAENEEEPGTVVIGDGNDDNGDADAYIEQTTLPQFNTLSVLQSATLENNGSLVLEEGISNATYAERFAYLKPGGDVTLPCNIVKLELPTKPKKVVYKWFNRDGINMEEYQSAGKRIKINNHFQIKIKNAHPQDSDNYFCVVSAVYPDHVVNFTNELHFRVYVDPDIGIQFPFIFEASTCNIYDNQVKMEEIRKSLCVEDPCQYEVQMECSTTPWFLKAPESGVQKESYVSKTILQVTATKFPHPRYRPPKCRRDCVMANKFDHIQENMGSLEQTLKGMTNTQTLIFLREETMKRRKVVYVCEEGYELHRENCVPCLPGQYSPVRGTEVCLFCPFDFYQDHAARNACIPCTTDYGTSTEGASSASACQRKIYFIRFTMPFFIFCGVVLGLVLVCCALLMAKYNNIFLLWIYSHTAKKTPGSKQQKVKESESSSEVNPLQMERLFDLLSYTAAAQSAYSSRGHTRAMLTQANEESGIRGQEAFPINPQQQFPQATLIAATGTKVKRRRRKKKPATVPEENDVTMPLPYPIPPGVIVPSNAVFAPVNQGYSVPPGSSVPPGDAVVSAQKQPSFHGTISNAKVATQDQGGLHHIPPIVNKSAQEQPSSYKISSSKNTRTQKDSGPNKTASSTKMSIQNPSFHKFSAVKPSTEDQAENVSAQSRERTRHVSSNLSMETRPVSNQKMASRSIHDANVNHNANANHNANVNHKTFTLNNQQSHTSELATYVLDQKGSNGLLFNKESFFSCNIGKVESQSRNVSKHRHAHRLAFHGAVETVEQSCQVHASRQRSHRKKTALHV